MVAGGPRGTTISGANKVNFSGKEVEYVRDVVQSNILSGSILTSDTQTDDGGESGWEWVAR